MYMKTAIRLFSFVLFITFIACQEEETGKAGMQAPEISVSNVTNSEVFFKVTVPEDAKEGKVYYGLTKADSAQPTAQEIVANDSKLELTGSKALNGSTTTLFSIKQLQSGKIYYLYSVLELKGELSQLSAKKEVKVQ